MLLVTVTGCSPDGYAPQAQCKRVKDELRDAGKVIECIPDREFIRAVRKNCRANYGIYGGPYWYADRKGFVNPAGCP